ncbi:Endoglucanase EG-II [Lachnellula occidentalis]|uniref:Endoglucanase EG-II n=1 Tax=Lachnellula occidentalis TaxID=215460 RepID=A0A8H8UHY0_9HELO|nr:Endoglucanase EG-II [Lachnellula occidentalis]
MKSSLLSSIVLASHVYALPATTEVRANTAVKYVASCSLSIAGVNMAGFDFGMDTNGTQNMATVYPPLSALGGPDGAGQMSHFVKDDNLNIFRLPVTWQYLTNSNIGTMDTTKLANYDKLVQACLSTGATCIIDIHNYARVNEQIIGQGGPSGTSFVQLWTQLATKYQGSSNIAFGVMNEPHDLDIDTWGSIVQLVVTAIRTAGAKSQMILLPGTGYTSAGAFVDNGSGAALMKVKNLDGSTTNLIFDVHQYLDYDFSGTHTECTTDNISGAWQPLATWLRTNKRQALNTETGGGNTASCEQYLCSAINFMNSNTDVFLGYVAWSAGSFDNTYELDLTPTLSGSTWTDTALMKACIAR